MVYQRSRFSVLLGPETIPGNETGSDNEDAQPTKKLTDKSGFDKMADSNVYKRTRPFQVVQPRPKLERFPSGLQLSGLKLHREPSSSRQEDDNGRNRNEMEGLVPYNTEITSFKFETASGINADNDGLSLLDISNVSHPELYYLQTVRSSRISGHHSSRVSRYFLNDFGLRSHRTDTFSGHSARRGVSADIKREIAEKANKHIRACQAIGNVKRGSNAERSYQGLRHTVSPSQAPLRQYQMDAFSKALPKSHTDNMLRVGQERAKNVPYLEQLRRNTRSLSRIKQVGILCAPDDPLPEISGRTLVLGFADNF